MKDFVFVSDFDGTLTEKDFYQIMIDKYLGSFGTVLFDSWKKGEIGVAEFLIKIFASINLSEEEILDDIINIPFDKSTKNLINSVINNNGDFIILSAGTAYYIERLLEHEGINNVIVISNKGIFKDRGIHIIHDTQSPYYSPIYGVDKAKAVETLKKQYKKLYYAGDSEPDFYASRKADIIFARSELEEMLKEKNIDSVSYKNCDEICAHLREKGVIIK